MIDYGCINDSDLGILSIDQEKHSIGWIMTIFLRCVKEFWILVINCISIVKLLYFDVSVLIKVGVGISAQ